MRKTFWAIALLSLLSSCSGNDDNSNSENPTDSTIIGKWVITKAVYDTSMDTIYYPHNGSCSKEVLEFHSDSTVEETVYADGNCQNGAGSQFEWWANGSSFRMGYQNSEAYKSLKITNGQLYFDGWEDWGTRKYYVKAGQ